MSSLRRTNHDRPLDLVRLVHWSRLTLGVGLLLILYTTLFPFDFFVRTRPSVQEALRGFDMTLTQPYALADFPRNVVLFVPFGFGLASLLAAHHNDKGRPFALVLFAGLFLSGSLEMVQALALLRFPALADVLSNGLGAGVGFWLFYLAGGLIWDRVAWIVDGLRPFLTPNRLLAAYFLYLAGWLVLAVWLQTITRLSNWDSQYPLIVGNEKTRDRPWQGMLPQFYLADRAFSTAEVAQLFAGESPTTVAGDALVANYDFTNPDANNFPQLIDQGTIATTISKEGVSLSEDHWLESEGPVTAVSDALASSSQLTLGLVAASSNLIQSGPARLVSISGDPYNRNMTVGQEGLDLVFRLRMPLTGENGRQPEFIIPNVFTDEQLHHIVITYDGTAVRLAVDNLENVYTIELLPAVALFTKTFPNQVDQMRMTQGSSAIFRLLYSFCLFLPWSGWLALVYHYRLPWHWRSALWLVLGMILLPLTWEVFLNLLMNNYAFQPGHVVIGAGVTAVSFFFVITLQRSNTQE